MSEDPRGRTDRTARGTLPGIVSGAGVGMIFGTAFGNAGIGLVLGAGFGLVIGAALDRPRKNSAS